MSIAGKIDLWNPRMASMAMRMLWKAAAASPVEGLTVTSAAIALACSLKEAAAALKLAEDRRHLLRVYRMGYDAYGKWSSQERWFTMGARP